MAEARRYIGYLGLPHLASGSTYSEVKFVFSERGALFYSMCSCGVKVVHINVYYCMTVLQGRCFRHMESSILPHSRMMHFTWSNIARPTSGWLVGCTF